MIVKIEKSEMEDYELSKNHLINYIVKHIDKTASFIARKFNISTKTVYRTKKLIRNSEIKDDYKYLTLTHGNKLQKRKTKVSNEIFSKIAEDYNEQNQFLKRVVNPKFGVNFNIYYFENVYQKYEISRAQFYRRMLSLGFCSPYANRETKKLIKKMLNNKLLDEELDEKTEVVLKLLVKQIEQPKEIKLYQNKSSSLDYGQVIEIDACEDIFFKSKEKCHIYHAVDAATKRVLALHCEKEETTLGYQKLLTRLFSKHGLPQVILSDKRRTMWGSENTETAFKKALDIRDIELISNSNPKHKPNVEHSFAILQKSEIYYFKLGQKN